MKYQREIIKVDDSSTWQAHMDAHIDFRLAAAIPWGDAIFLVFEKEEEPPQEWKANGGKFLRG